MTFRERHEEAGASRERIRRRRPLLGHAPLPPGHLLLLGLRDRPVDAAVGLPGSGRVLHAEELVLRRPPVRADAAPAPVPGAAEAAAELGALPADLLEALQLDLPPEASARVDLLQHL